MTIPHRNPGDKKLPATDYNQLVDAANFVQRNRPKFEAGTNELEGRTPGTILIKNNTGADRARGDAVGIGSQLFDLNYYTIEMKNTSFFSGDTLTSAHIGRFAILAEPIKEDEVGEAFIALECYAKIWIPDGATLESHGYADVFDLTNSPNNLTATGSGTCQILWFDDTVSDALGDAKIRFQPKLDGVPFINESGETIPPYGVMEVLSTDANGIAHIVKPTVNRGNPYLVNRGAEVIDDAYGTGDYGYDKPVRMLIATADAGTDNNAMFFAPALNQWKASLNTTGAAHDEESFGFKLCGATGDTTVVSGASVYWGTQAKENAIQSLSVPLTVMKNYSGSTITEIEFAGAYDEAWLTTEHDKESYRLGWKTTNHTNPRTNSVLECLRDGMYRVEFYYNFSVHFDPDGADAYYDLSTTSDGTPAHTHTYKMPKFIWFSQCGSIHVDIDEGTGSHVVGSARNIISVAPTADQTGSNYDDWYINPNSPTYTCGILTLDKYYSVGEGINVKVGMFQRGTNDLTPFLELSSNTTIQLVVTRLRNQPYAN